MAEHKCPPAAAGVDRHPLDTVPEIGPGDAMPGFMMTGDFARAHRGCLPRCHEPKTNLIFLPALRAEYIFLAQLQTEMQIGSSVKRSTSSSIMAD